MSDRSPRDNVVPLPSSNGRVPPHDLDAEGAVISAIMLEREALDRVLDILAPEHFYSESNRRIFEAALALAAPGTPIDIVSVGAWLRDRDRLAQVGGSAYLALIVDTVPSVAHVETYARIVKEKWRVRQMIAISQRNAAEGYGDVGDPQTWIDGCEQRVYEIARSAETVTTQLVGPIVRSEIARVSQAAERGERITGTATGFDRLDTKIAGLHDGELTIIASRPGMGKTSLALNMATNVALPKTDADPTQGVAVFSLEMPKEQLVNRLICAEGRVDIGRMRQGTLQKQDWDSIISAASEIDLLPIWIDDSPNLSVLELRAKVRRLQAEYNRPRPDGTFERRLSLVIIDYLQLMRASSRAQNREQEISEISRGLKGLSKELRTPVIALSQLNRSVETRGSKDKRPQLSDLRESGAIEQDADNIIFIFRDDYYDKNSDRRGLAELIVAKQRNGPTGRVMARWNAHCTRFDNLAPGEVDDEDEEDVSVPAPDYPRSSQDDQ